MNEIITYYSKTPPNKFEMKDATLRWKEENRSCSDTIEVFLKIEDQKIVAWSFEWITSIITTACASIFWESIIGMELNEVLTKDYAYIVWLIGEEISPRRKKWAIFWILATRNAIHKYLWDGKTDTLLDLIDEE